MMRMFHGMTLVLLAIAAGPARGQEPTPLAKGVRGLVTLAKTPVEVDGQLKEWTNAFCTPLGYSHKTPEERAGQFFYMWDDQALYVGLRCLDRHQGNNAPVSSTFNGDAVEFYLDTRSGDSLRQKDWGPGAIHFYFSAFQGTKLDPRWTMRKGIATSDVVLKGVEIAATQDEQGYELEFKLPWSNFPDFKPKLGALLALDAELCYADGKQRMDRAFAYGSPLSVHQPASQALVELVRDFDPDYFPAVGPAAFPFWVDTPAIQQVRGEVQAVVAIPPSFADIAGAVNIRIHDTDGKVVKTLPAAIETIGRDGGPFLRAVARWSIDDFAPNTYFPTAQISSRTDKVITTVAPRLVSEGMISGR